MSSPKEALARALEREQLDQKVDACLREVKLTRVMYAQVSGRLAGALDRLTAAIEDLRAKGGE